MCVSSDDERFTRWTAALETRHLADLRLAEVTRALRALSSAYVQRRHKLQTGAALDSAGKRAAFALFYGPLHLLTVARILEIVAARTAPPASIVDLGCGTGVAGAAWALCHGGAPRILGIDRHPWAVEESRRTFRDLAVRGQARVGDLTRVPSLAPSAAVVAAYSLNELSDERRRALQDRVFAAAERGTRVLVVEPIARGVAPWWHETASRVKALGGRADEWRFPADLSPLLQLLDKAAGLHHRELTARSVYLG
jgi:hypothetical protein